MPFGGLLPHCSLFVVCLLACLICLPALITIACDRTVDLPVPSFVLNRHWSRVAVVGTTRLPIGCPSTKCLPSSPRRPKNSLYSVATVGPNALVIEPTLVIPHWAVGRFSGQFLRQTELIKRSFRLDDEPTWWWLEPLHRRAGRYESLATGGAVPMHNGCSRTTAVLPVHDAGCGAASAEFQSPPRWSVEHGMERPRIGA